MKFIILIPAYEPNYELLNLLNEINNKYTTIIVNDGSNKSYDNIFKSAKKYAHVISYEKNMGKGYAIKTGLNYIKNTFDNYIVVTMDADGQHKLTDAINLCKYVEKNKKTLALGRRSWNKSTPLKSRIGNSITRNIFKNATGLSIYDTQTGLRAFSYKLNDYMLSIDGNRYEYEMNVLLNLKNNNILFKEIKIDTIYIDNNKSSHFNAIKDSYKIYKMIFKWHRANKK